MKKPIAPCFKCEDRVLGCHSTCERYKAYTGDVGAWREQRGEMRTKEEHTHIKVTQSEIKRRKKK